MNKDVRNIALALLTGLVAGWFLARGGLGSGSGAPSTWIARVGDEYITPELFIAEMHRRGGETPGQYQDIVQKRALLDDMVLRRALVSSARADKLDEDAEIRHQIDQTLANQYLQRTLRKQQQALTVSDAEVRAHYDAHVADYLIPARRRVAMVQIRVPAGATDEVWANAMERGEQVLAKARKLGPAVPHFAEIAREYSEDQASRYRGGMIGWIAEGQSARYRYDPVVLEAAMAARKAGDFSEVLRGLDGVYVVRVVDIEPQRERPFEQLATGIHQRLLQERMAAAEQSFRKEVLKRVRVQVREDELERIDPLAPPAAPQPPQPPAMPNQ